MSGARKKLAVSALVYLVPVVALQAGCALAEPPNSPEGSSQERFTGPPLLDRTIRDGRITESSGLARSTYQQGVLFTHNDRGDAARIFAVLDDGRTDAVLTVEGARNRDWEDIAAGPRHRLWIADIGDNAEQRSFVEVYRVPEPAQLATGSVEATRFRLRYPDGAHNAEALLVQPDSGRVYIVTKKTSGAGIYRAPKPLSRGSVNPLVREAAAPPGVTGGAFYPDGGGFVLRTQNSAYFYEDFGRAPRSVPLPRQEQGESIEMAADGSYILIGSEGDLSPVYRIR